MKRPAMIVDTETTSLVADYATGSGVIWELAIIEWPHGDSHLWRMEPDVSLATPAALEVGRYHERTRDMRHPSGYVAHDLTQPGDEWWSADVEVAEAAGSLLDGATLIAANPTFDAAFLAQLFLTYGQAKGWHYRLRDIGSMAYAWLHGNLQGARRAVEAAGMGGRIRQTRAIPDMDAGTDDFATALGLDLTKYDRHTALGDCRMVADMLAVIEGGAL